ncbi:MAG: tetratricopeptide repeat protein [Ferruginibacter sp.]
MKRSSLLILLILMSSLLFAQNMVVDSLYAALSKEKKDTAKIILLYNLSHAYQDSKPDSALLLAQDAYLKAKKINFLKGESWSLSQMAIAFNNLGNFPRALGYYIEQLKIEEARNRPDNIASIFLNLALVYTDSKDYDKAIVYAKKGDSIINANKIDDLSLYSLLNIGDIYQKKNQLDSALAYTRRCYAKSVQANNNLITGTALNNLGNIFFKTSNLKEALNNYRTAQPYLQSSNDLTTYAEGMLGLARIFELRQQFDSAIVYGRMSFDISSGNQFLVKALDASSFLSQVYKKQQNIDSAFFYHEIMSGIKDSIDSREKIKEVQNITTQEQLRQNEIVRMKQEEKKERSQKLQLLMIGIAIPVFFLISVFISRKKVNKKMIEFSGILSILLLFEYITLLLHPFIAEKSHHSPLIEIVIFVAIAAIITPSHHKIEHWLINKLTELNYLKHHKPKPVEPANEENINEEETVDEGPPH